MEVKNIKPHYRNNTFKNNKNVNFIIVKNLRRPVAVNIRNYIPLLKKHNLLESGDSNTNVNLIIIQNVITEDVLKAGVKIKELPNEDSSGYNVVKRIFNKNINFIVVRNVIPIKKYCD